MHSIAVGKWHDNVDIGALRLAHTSARLFRCGKLFGKLVKDPIQPLRVPARPTTDGNEALDRIAQKMRVTQLPIPSSASRIRCSKLLGWVGSVALTAAGCCACSSFLRLGFLGAAGACVVAHVAAVLAGATMGFPGAVERDVRERRALHLGGPRQAPHNLDFGKLGHALKVARVAPFGKCDRKGRSGCHRASHKIVRPQRLRE